MKVAKNAKNSITKHCGKADRARMMLEYKWQANDAFFRATYLVTKKGVVCVRSTLASNDVPDVEAFALDGYAVICKLPPMKKTRDTGKASPEAAEGKGKGK